MEKTSCLHFGLVPIRILVPVLEPHIAQARAGHRAANHPTPVGGWRGEGPTYYSVSFSRDFCKASSNAPEGACPQSRFLQGWST